MRSLHWHSETGGGRCGRCVDVGGASTLLQYGVHSTLALDLYRQPAQSGEDGLAWVARMHIYTCVSVHFPQIHSLTHTASKMELYLSRNSTTSTILSRGSSSDDATPLYHIYTPTTFITSKPTAISRISPAVAGRPELRGKKSSGIKATSRTHGVEEFAKIKWKSWSENAQVIYNGSTTAVDTFMPAQGKWRGYVLRLAHYQIY